MPGVTGAAIPIKLNGRDFMFSPLTDRDTDLINEYIRSQIVKTANDFAYNGDFTGDKEALIQRAITSAAGESIMTREGVKIIGTVDGMTFLTWLSIRKESPDVTREELFAMLQDPANISHVNAAFTRANITVEGMIAKKGKVGRIRQRRMVEKRKKKKKSTTKRKSTSR